MRRLVDRPLDANKYDFGHVLVVGGSSGMVGAPLLTGMAALRMGAGLVTIASEEASTRQLERRVEEIMTLAIPSYDRVDDALQAVSGFIRTRKVTVLIIGPGLPPEAAPTVRRLVQQIPLPIVLDAGGLTAFKGHLAMLRQAAGHNPRVIITPHSGEFDKLTDASSSDDSGRRERAMQFAKQYHLTVVLKGRHTLIAHPEGVVYKNRTGNPGLATAGTGDVLAGIIGGLLAQGFESGQAAEAGTYLHGLAGDKAAAEKTEAGMIASDVIDFLPAALKETTAE